VNYVYENIDDGVDGDVLERVIKNRLLLVFQFQF